MNQDVGTFADEVRHGAGNGAYGLAIGDMTGDGSLVEVIGKLSADQFIHHDA